MSGDPENFPDDFPDILRHSEEDSPVPTWLQITRSADAINEEMIAHISRIVAGTDDEEAARAVWRSWPGNYRRSVGLLVDKIYHEGWLDSVGRIEGWPWDGGFFFLPRVSEQGSFTEVMESKSGRGRAYTECSLRGGLLAYINKWSHKGWRRGWMENDAALAALHIGIFKSGTTEVHLDVFNSLYINGAPSADLVKIPLLGAYNHRLFKLHRRWEMTGYAGVARKSANFYHMMRDTVPLSF